MLDFQRIVDDVRSSLFSNSAEGVDFLRSAAADYSVVCDEVNERLRRCGALLKQGLRSEAIQLAEIEPNLLDLVATLDFPERNQWIDVVGHYGIVAPPPLMLDVAADLNEAYALEQPLADLLRRHRLGALGRSPLKLRIHVLRKLSQADANNPVWNEDLSIFEKERQKQLQSEVAEAVRAADAGAVATLDDELRGDWLELPPLSLVNWTAGARRDLENKDIRAELVEAADTLNDCHALGNVELGRQWRQRWKEVAAQYSPPPGDDLLQRAQQALEWLAGQDALEKRRIEHNAAVVKLAAALHGAAPAEELKRRRDRARANGFDISPEMERQYRARLEELKRARVRRKRIAIAVAAASVFVIAGLTALGILNHLRNRRVEEQTTALTKLLDDGELTEAQLFVDQLNNESPSIAASDEIQQLITERLQPAFRKEAERHEAFESALQDAKAPGPEHPDDDALTEANLLAKTGAERRELEQFKEQIGERNRAEADKQAARFKTELADLGQRLAKFEAQPHDDIATTQAKVAELRSELKALEGRSTLVPDVDGQAGPFRARLDTIEASLQGRLTEESLLEAVTKAATQASGVGDIEAYRNALASYVRRLPESPRSADFKRSLRDAPLWIGLDKWNALLQKFRHSDLTAIGPDAAKNLLAAAKPVMADFGGYPDAEAVGRLNPYLEAVTRRVDADNARITKKLKDLFDDPLMSPDLWIADAADGRRWYLKDELTPGDTTQFWHLEYISGFDMEPKKQSMKPGETVGVDKSPQGALAKAVKPLLIETTDENWETSFSQIIRAISEASKVDPILRFNLLKQTLEIGCRGSQVLKTAYREQSDALNGAADIDVTANWLEPKDADANRSRKHAKALFQNLPNLKTAERRVAEELKTLQKPVGTRYRWVGWLRRGEAGGWRCDPARLGSETGELFAPVANPTGGLSLCRAGKVERGVSEVDAAADKALVEGRPIYMTEP